VFDAQRAIPENGPQSGGFALEKGRPLRIVVGDDNLYRRG
jgi:hypothetical protein